MDHARHYRDQLQSNRLLDERLTEIGGGLDSLLPRIIVADQTVSVEALNASRFQSIVDGVIERTIGIEMALRQTRTACALERFRESRGAYPASLDELVPEFLAAVPLDVIDGAPVRYARSADQSFQLYSIGLNGKDDGGSAVIDRRSVGMYKARDWMWRESWTR
jgi:hypothetical protein